MDTYDVEIRVPVGQMRLAGTAYGPCWEQPLGWITWTYADPLDVALKTARDMAPELNPKNIFGVRVTLRRTE